MKLNLICCNVKGDIMNCNMILNMDKLKTDLETKSSLKCSKIVQFVQNWAPSRKCAVSITARCVTGRFFAVFCQAHACRQQLVFLHAPQLLMASLFFTRFAFSPRHPLFYYLLPMIPSADISEEWSLLFKQ